MQSTSHASQGNALCKSHDHGLVDIALHKSYDYGLVDIALHRSYYHVLVVLHLEVSLASKLGLTFVGRETRHADPMRTRESVGSVSTQDGNYPGAFRVDGVSPPSGPEPPL